MTPDIAQEVPEKPEVLEEKTPDQVLEMLGLEKSTDAIFNKKRDFIVLKGHIFNIQAVSPKKIILKLKEKTTRFEPIPDGIFLFPER